MWIKQLYGKWCQFFTFDLLGLQFNSGNARYWAKCNGKLIMRWFWSWSVQGQRVKTLGGPRGGDSTKNQRRPRNGGLKHMKWNEEMPGWGSLGWRIVKELSIFNMKLQWMKLSVLIRGTGHWTQSVSALYLLCSLMLHVRQFLCHWPVSTKKMAWC